MWLTVHRKESGRALPELPNTRFKFQQIVRFRVSFVRPKNGGGWLSLQTGPCEGAEVTKEGAEPCGSEESGEQAALLHHNPLRGRAVAERISAERGVAA